MAQPIPPSDPFDAFDTFTEAPDETAAIATAPAPAAPAPAGPAPGGKGPKAKAAGPRKDTLLLGLHVTPRQVFGVLVRPTPEGYEPLRQFVRTRAEPGAQESLDSMAALSPDGVDLGFSTETPSMGDGDASVQFGTAEIDFSAEFAGIATDTFDDFSTAGATTAGTASMAQPVVFEIKDILEECAQAGFVRPALAFAVGPPDVEYVELSVIDDKKGGKGSKKPKAKKGPASDDAAARPPVKRDKLVALLQKEEVPFDKDRVAFLRMTPRGEIQRYLAIVPTGTEAVVPSLSLLREQGRHRKTEFRALEAEVPLLVGLAGLTTPAEPTENTALVRVGTEDTIVLLLAGGRLRHVEQMQSVTAFDGPDTICSRVLLQQDVQGVGTVHNVVIVADERERELVQGFAAFYPEARVETLREGLARLGLVGPYGPLAPNLVEAAGAAIAGHVRRGKASPFEDTNLLPSGVMKRKRGIDLSFGWHTLLVAVLLFVAVLYFVFLFVSQQNQIADSERQLAEFPVQATMSAPQLQARIDSLRMRQADLTASLVTLDSLLIDTDRWTQTLLRTTRAASATGGIWIEEWEPNGGEIGLKGFATNRSRVVALAQRLNATIQEVTFQNVRNYPVYAYRLAFGTPRDLPQITRVLREQAGEYVPPPSADPLAGLGPPPPSSFGTPAPDTPPAPPPAAPEGGAAPVPSAPSNE